MNILITGATGFIGRNLIHALSHKNEIHVVVRPSTVSDSIDSQRIFVFKDNIDELKDYLVEKQIEGIIHLASLYITKHQNEQIKDLILSNVYFGTSVLDAAKQANVRWFINTGSYWQNYTPDSKEYRPVNLYTATKQAFIDIAEFYIDTSSIRFVTLKICDTYGPNDTRKKIMSLFKQHVDSGEQLKMSPGEQKWGNLYVIKEPLFSVRIIDSCASAGFKWDQARIFNALIDKYQKEGFIRLTWINRAYCKTMAWIMCIARNLVFKFAN